MSGDRPFTGTAYHGSRATIDSFRIDPERGAYFASEPAHALDHGPVLHVCVLNLSRPIRYTEAQANADMEIERGALISQGHDGRIVEYDDGTFDYVAFHPEQIRVVEAIAGATASSDAFARPRRDVGAWCRQPLSEAYQAFRRAQVERAFGLPEGHVAAWLAEPPQTAIGHELAKQVARWCADNPDSGPNGAPGDDTHWATIALD